MILFFKPHNYHVVSETSVEISVYTMFRVLYVCPFVALSKAKFAENVHIVLSGPYSKKRSFLTPCVF